MGISLIDMSIDVIFAFGHLVSRGLTTIAP